MNTRHLAICTILANLNGAKFNGTPKQDYNNSLPTPAIYDPVIAIPLSRKRSYFILDLILC